jgi:hypothetical protein
MFQTPSKNPKKPPGFVDALEDTRACPHLYADPPAPPHFQAASPVPPNTIPPTSKLPSRAKHPGQTCFVVLPNGRETSSNDEQKLMEKDAAQKCFSDLKSARFLTVKSWL